MEGPKLVYFQFPGMFQVVLLTKAAAKLNRVGLTDDVLSVCGRKRGICCSKEKVLDFDDLFDNSYLFELHYIEIITLLQCCLGKSKMGMVLN